MACYRDRVLTIDPRSNSDGCTRLCRHVQRGNVINPRGKIQTKTSLPLSSCGYDLTPRLVETISIGSWIERFQDLVPSRARDDRRFGEGRKNVIEQCRTILSLSSAASSRCNAPMVPNLAWLVSTNASRQVYRISGKQGAGLVPDKITRTPGKSAFPTQRTKVT